MRARLIAPSLIVVAVSLLLLPMMASAQGVLETLGLANRILNGLIGLLVLVAILAFFWGVISYVLIASGDDQKKNAVRIMMYGVIAIFVMVSIWGIIRLLQSTLGINPNEPSRTPSGIVAF